MVGIECQGGDVGHGWLMHTRRHGDKRLRSLALKIVPRGTVDLLLKTYQTPAWTGHLVVEI